MPEPSTEDTFDILMGLKDRYEAYHKVTYKEEALKSAVELSSKYIKDRFLPDNNTLIESIPDLLSCKALLTALTKIFHRTNRFSIALFPEPRESIP